MNFKNFLEAFETTHDFLLNQDYSDKTFSQLLHDFEQSGGKMIGVGKYGQVFQHPNWNYVLKTFHDDACYLKFCRFVYKNPHPSFPKLYGLPKQIIPQFKRTYPILYYVRIEKLLPAENSKEAVAFLQRGFNPTDYEPQYIQQQQELLKQYNMQKSLPRNQRTIQFWDINHHLFDQLEILKKFPQLKSLAEGIKILNNHNFKCALDIHDNNIMQRQNGELVLIDPLWYGESPYMQELKNRESYYDLPDDEPELIPGGKLPKKPKPKKPQLQTVTPDDTPF